jgi:Ion channel
LYFSAASYSTVGYGDVVLPRFWRVLGPLESVTGVLMCAISVSALFAILIRLLESETQSSSEIRMGPPSLADQPLDADSVNDMG